MPSGSRPAGTGADLLWRVKKNTRLPCRQRLADGSYLSVVYPSERDRRHDTNGVIVRVIEYTLAGVADAEDLYRAGDDDPESRSGARRVSWPRSTTSAGRSRRRSTN